MIRIVDTGSDGVCGHRRVWTFRACSRCWVAALEGAIAVSRLEAIEKLSRLSSTSKFPVFPEDTGKDTTTWSQGLMGMTSRHCRTSVDGQR